MDEKGVSRFSVEPFWSESAEKIRSHHFNVSKNLGYRKNLCILGGITFFPRKILVSQCKKSRRHPFNTSQKLGYGKFYASEREGVSRFSVENFCHTTKNFRWGTVRCFRNILVSQEFMHSKGISLKSVENFLSHSAEKLCKWILLFLKKSGFEKFCRWKEEYHVFPSIFFGLTVLENFVGITSMLQKNRDIEKFYA